MFIQRESPTEGEDGLMTQVAGNAIICTRCRKNMAVNVRHNKRVAAKNVPERMQWRTRNE